MIFHAFIYKNGIKYYLYFLFQVVKMPRDFNPWEVENIFDFSFFCCPECVYRSKEEFEFQAHALQNHPRSERFFQPYPGDTEQDENGLKVEIKLEPGTDLPDMKSENNEDDEDEDEKIEPYMDNNDDHMDEDYIPVEEPEEPEERKEPIEPNEPIEHIKCTKCPEEFDTRTKFVDHMIDNHDENRNNDDDAQMFIDEAKCPKCHEIFESLVEMALHYNNDHDRDIKDYQCPVCDRTAPSGSKLKVHIEGYHLKMKTKCPSCDTYVSIKGLRNHMRTSKCDLRANKPFKCEECDFCTHGERYLKNHIMRNHRKEINPHACDKCEKTFVLPELLEEHIEVVHEKKKLFFCDKCGKGFPKRKKYLFNKHVSRGFCVAPRKSVKPDPATCQQCNEDFSGIQFLIQHYRNIHGTLPPAYLNKELFMCDQCPNVYRSKDSLKKHIRVIHSGKPAKKIRKCPHCEKEFITIPCLKEHIAVKHEGNTPYKCPQCQRAFGTMDRLKTHERNVHRRLKCEECGQEFCNTFILKRHKASVHGIRPTGVFQCPACPLFFNQKVSLDKHVVKHLDT